MINIIRVILIEVHLDLICFLFISIKKKKKFWPHSATRGILVL